MGVLAALAACGGDDGMSGDPDAASDIDATGCDRTPAAADRPRNVVVSLPYTDAGAQASRYRVATLDASGALAFTSTTFDLGRSLIGTITFTPDGEVGIVAQDDGSLGVFRFEADGATVAVVHARFDGSFYADRVFMDPAGQVAYVIDPNTRNNGGGIYRVDIGCDGTLTDRGLWIAARSPGGLVLRGNRALLAAKDVGASSPAGHDVHWLDLSVDPPVRLGSADIFGDDAIFGGAAVTDDGQFGLIGDVSGFSSEANSVAVVRIVGDVLTSAQRLTPVEDPLSIVASPSNDAAMVASGFGDALIALDYAPPAATPFSVRGPLTYAGARPELPGDAVMIDRGGLRGLVLVAENLGVRRVGFAGSGAVTDLGKTPTGTGTGNIVGTIGVQP